MEAHIYVDVVLQLATKFCKCTSTFFKQVSTCFTSPFTFLKNTSTMPSSLRIHIIIYAEPSLRENEAHVALSVAVPGEQFVIFHATEGASTENELMFERRERDQDPLRTKTTHQTLRLDVTIWQGSFDKLSDTLSSTPVPRPRSNGWNCQSWVHEAMVSMERANLMRRGSAKIYYDQMMRIIAANTTTEGIYTG